MSAPEITVEPITADGWKVWREVRLQALEESPHAFGSTLADWQGDGDREERWRARLGLPGSANFVARVGGEPVGIASGVPDEHRGDARELISMWIAPGVRRTGVARKLMEAVESWARQDGAVALTLMVADANPGAERFYLRMGYTCVPDSTQAMPDGVRTEHAMAKSLGPDVNG